MLDAGNDALTHKSVAYSPQENALCQHSETLEQFIYALLVRRKIMTPLHPLRERILCPSDSLSSTLTQ